MKTPLLAGKRAVLPAALFCCFLWGSAFPTVKAGLAYFTPTLFAGIRFMIAGLAVTALAYRRLGGCLDLARCWRPVLAIGFFQTVIGYYLFFHGMAWSSAITGSIINSSGPVMVAVLAYFLLGEGGWSPTQVAGAVFGLLGVVLALVKPGWRPDFHWRGEGLLLLSGLSLSYASIMVKKIAAEVDPLVISGGSMTSGGAALLALAAATEPLSSQVWTARSTTLLLYAAFISAAAFTLWYILLRYHPVSTVSAVKFTIPIFGTVLSTLTLGETLTASKAMGGCLVGLGIYLIFFRREKAPRVMHTGP